MGHCNTFHDVGEAETPPEAEVPNPASTTGAGEMPSENNGIPRTHADRAHVQTITLEHDRDSKSHHL